MGDPLAKVEATEETEWCSDNMKLPTSRGVLSAAEIEMLLRPNLDDLPIETVSNDTADRHDIQNLDDSSLENDAASLAAQLTLAARKDCDLDIIFASKSASIEDFASSPFLLDNNSILIMLEQSQRGVVAALGFSGVAAAALIDSVYGGGAAMGLSSVDRQRPFSSLDRIVLERVLTPLAACIDPNLRVSCVESSPAAASAILPPGRAVVAELSCRIGKVEGGAVFARLEDAAGLSAHSPRGELDRGTIKTTLVARIASLSVPVSRLADLKAGSTLLLGLPTNPPVDLLSGTRAGPIAAEGEVGRKGEKIAVRITKPYRVTCN
ncbi:MAG: FliM/FliN family flagellar motor switch protein [Pseudomonadota bacterium]